MITQLVIMGQRGSISSGGSSSTRSNRTRARPTDKPGHIAGLAALPFACVLAARSPVEGTRAGPAEPEISPVTAIQTLGQIGLSLWPEILAFESDSGADTRCQMAMRLDDAQLDEFSSQFLILPQPSVIPRSMSVIAGPALDSAPNPLYVQDAIGSAGSRCSGLRPRR
jgi:hypothetical protein